MTCVADSGTDTDTGATDSTDPNGKWRCAEMGGLSGGGRGGTAKLQKREFVCKIRACLLL